MRRERNKPYSCRQVHNAINLVVVLINNLLMKKKLKYKICFINYVKCNLLSSAANEDVK